MENEENQPPDNLDRAGSRPKLYYSHARHRLSPYNARIYRELEIELESRPSIKNPEAHLDRLIRKFGASPLRRLVGHPPRQWPDLLNEQKWEKIDPV
jgi:hypothetical protein